MSAARSRSGSSSASKQARKNAASRRAAGRSSVGGGPADISELGAHPDLDFRPVVDYFAQRSTELDVAFARFTSQVDPSQEARSDAASQRALSNAFIEWFVFDSHLANGRTPLEHFVVSAPAKADRRVVELFRQVAATQLFSLFWVRAIDPAAHTVTLEDAADGATYEVYDARLGDTLPGARGLMAVRLAQVAGEWRCPCDVAMYREIEHEEGFGSAVAELAGMGHKVGLIEIAHLLYGTPDDGVTGPDGRVARGSGGVPRAAAEAGSPGADVPPERRAAYLAGLRLDYARMAERYGLGVSWDGMAAAIKTCPGDRVAHDVVEQLFGAGAGDLDELDDDAFGDLMTIFLSAWNLLPHDYLDGHSPAEVIQGR